MTTDWRCLSCHCKHTDKSSLCSHVGRRVLHQRHCRSNIYNRTSMVPSANRV